MNVKSSFNVVRVEFDRVIIADNDGKRSVTNDAENVVRHLYNLYGDKRFFYYDTQNEFGELVHRLGEFLRFG